jgi:biopolymer transport protein ExbD
VLGTLRIASDDELEGLLREAHDDYVRLGKPDTPVTIDAEARVPWNDVIAVMNLCKKNRIDKIEFALGAPPPAGQ